MLNMMKRRSVDLLIDHFWKQGYLTVSRKYGTYLPEPAKVGKFDVDIVAKYKNNYAIGITLNEQDLNDPKIINKITFLSTRKTKYTNKKVLLFVGVPEKYLNNAKSLIESLEQEIKKNIKAFPIVEKSLPSKHTSKDYKKILFS